MKLLKTIKKKLIHALGGVTVEEGNAIVKEAIFQTSVEIQACTIQAIYLTFMGICDSINGCDKQVWIDTIYETIKALEITTDENDND